MHLQLPTLLNAIRQRAGRCAALFRVRSIPSTLIVLTACQGGTLQGQDGRERSSLAPAVDHHQHLLSPAGVEVVNRRLPKPEQQVTAQQLVAMLDVAAVRRAIVVSNACYFDSPLLGTSDDPARAARVRAENDWTAEQVAQFADRLVAFCSLNPLADYALPELDRCRSNPVFKGLKLHFGASAVNLANRDHLEKVTAIVRAANGHRLPLVVHVRANQSYGREHALVFLNEILPAAPAVTVTIAHLWGGEGFPEPALEAYADAASSGNPVTRNLYFDVAELARVLEGRTAPLERTAALIRRIGITRILYGSDGPVFGNVQPKEAWGNFIREVPLTAQEFDTIAGNVLPSLR